MTGKKGTLGWILCEEGVTMKVSTGLGGRVILAGKSQREKTAQIIEKYIIGSKHICYEQCITELPKQYYKSERIGVSHNRWVIP